MKKAFLLLTMSLGLMASASAQNEQGQVYEYYQQGVHETDVVAYCTAQFTNVCKHTTFKITNDETDSDGIRHITLRQYIDGYRSRQGILLVHMREDAIKAIQGTVMTQEMDMAPSRRAPIRSAEALQQAGLPEALAENLEPELLMIDGVCHLVYVVYSDPYQFTVDAQTGELLSKYSTVMNYAQDDEYQIPGTTVEGTATTFYSGERTMSFMQDAEQGYYLSDASRNIWVLDASGNQLMSKGITLEQLHNISRGSITLTDIIAASGSYTNNSTNWTDTTLGVEIDSLVFNAMGEQCLAWGKRLYAVLAYDEEKSYVTDTALIDSNYVPLHFAEPVEGQILDYSLTFYSYNPETNTSEEYFKVNCMQQYNTQYIVLSDLVFAADDPDLEEKQMQYMTDMVTNGLVFACNRMFGYQPVNDVLWGMEQVYDYYLETFNWKSFDGQGTLLPCLVNGPDWFVPANNASAHPDGMAYMTFGLGGSRSNPFVQLQIMGHEFTHLVARNLNDCGQDSPTVYCRALNESFADIMGLAVERYATGREYWDIGVEVRRDGKPERSFEDPEQYGGPSCFEGNNFDKTRFEEHNNSCVQSHMFYLLVTGGEGINSMGNDYYVVPMDRTEAEALAFSTLKEYTFDPMDYLQAAQAWYTAARLKFGENSTQARSVAQAWAAVNLPLGDITGIDQICHDRQTTGRRYNLRGQVVGEGYRGLFIER